MNMRLLHKNNGQNYKNIQRKLDSRVINYILYLLLINYAIEVAIWYKHYLVHIRSKFKLCFA